MKIQSLICDVIEKLDPDFLIIQNDGTEWTPEELADDIRHDLKLDQTSWAGDYDLVGEQIVELQEGNAPAVLFDLKFQIKILYTGNAEWIRENEFYELPHFVTDDYLVLKAGKILDLVEDAGFDCEPANLGGYNQWNGYQFFEHRCGMFATKQKLSDEQWQVFCDAYDKAVQKEVAEFYAGYDLTCKICGAEIDRHEFWEEFQDGKCNNEVCEKCMQEFEPEEIEDRVSPTIKIDLNRFYQLEELADTLLNCNSISNRIKEALRQESEFALANKMEIELLKRIVLQDMLADWEFFTTDQTSGEAKRNFISPEYLDRIAQQNELGNYLQELIERSYV
jgi:hypothetical protein